MGRHCVHLHRTSSTSSKLNISGFLNDHAFLHEDNPKLDQAVYEYVLNEFLLTDPKVNFSTMLHLK